MYATYSHVAGELVWLTVRGSWDLDTVLAWIQSSHQSPLTELCDGLPDFPLLLSFREAKLLQNSTADIIKVHEESVCE